MIREVFVYKKHFIDFYKSQETKMQEKIGYVLDFVRFERHVPSKFFKSIRILCFFDQGDVVVLTNVFSKKHKRHREMKLEWLRD